MVVGAVAKHFVGGAEQKLATHLRQKVVTTAASDYGELTFIMNNTPARTLVASLTLVVATCGGHQTCPQYTGTLHVHIALHSLTPRINMDTRYPYECL
jgi:hypothetical protein